MRRAPDINWEAMALAGDAGAVAPELLVSGGFVSVPAVVARRWRPGKMSMLLLAGWLVWEAAGVARAVTIGPPILEAIWRAGS